MSYLSFRSIRALTAFLLVVGSSARAQDWEFTVLKGFESAFVGIQGGILRTPDGMLYGTSYGGGRNQLGGLFRVRDDGTGFTVLYHFDALGGYQPYAELIQGADGLLYGTAQSGGAGFGTVFKVLTNGTGFQVLHTFDMASGAYPYAGLVQGADGTLYGAASQGGATGQGTIFKVQPDGSGFTTIHSFNGPNGASPRATLTLIGGTIFGTTYGGGAFDYGTVFSLAADGSGFVTLHSFTPGDGTNPQSRLIQGTDGALYGTAFQGAIGYGSVFKLQTNGSGFSVVTTLTAGSGYAAGGVVQGLDGALYGGGHHCCGGASIYRVQTDGANFTTLRNLVPAEGSGIITPLVEAPDGTLIGVTQSGGLADSGIVFRLAPDGTGFSTLHALKDEAGQGALHQGSLAVIGNGHLLGITRRGGTGGAGAVFDVADDGSYFFPVHSLNPSLGKYSQGGLLRGQDGAFYGTTQLGGPLEAGTVFKVQADGSGYTVLRAFNGSDGNQPQAGLTQGPDGTLYGTTFFSGVFKLRPDGSDFVALGGLGFVHDSPVALGPDGYLYVATSQGGNGAGLVYRLRTDATDPTPLHVFSGADGASPNAVIVGSDGKLYGTTRYGGNVNGGTLFRMALDGSGFETLRVLSGLDGGNPAAALLQVDDGTLIGTAQGGGAGGHGTVFSVRPDGSGFTVLHAFSGDDGSTPWAPVVADDAGVLYGTTYVGSPWGGGVVYKLTPARTAASASIADASAREGGVATFVVTLSAASLDVVRVDLATSQGTARGGLDYVPVVRTLTFAPGETAKQVRVAVRQDALHEGDETFLVVLSNPVGAGLGRAQATGTIVDDDPAPFVAITDLAVAEGRGGRWTLRVPVVLSQLSGRDVSLTFTTFDGTATAPGDYSSANGILTIPAGRRFETVNIEVNGDHLREGDENFFVVLSAPVGARVGRSTGKIVLRNDDHR